MSKVFEIGTKVIVQSDVLTKMGGDAYHNNCWEVTDTSRDREDNVMHWLKNTETDMEPEQFFYFEELHEYHDKIECNFEELDDKTQDLLAYIEHAQEDLMLVCSGRSTRDQDMNSVVAYLESAVEVAKFKALSRTPSKRLLEKLELLVDLNHEFCALAEDPELSYYEANYDEVDNLFKEFVQDLIKLFNQDPANILNLILK